MLKKIFNKYSVLILIFIFLFVVLSFANIHFGIVSAVKKKVKELKEKKDSTLVVRPAPDTVILNETTLNNFSRQEGSLLYFSLDATEIGNLQQGKIIIGTKGEGFLRRVVSVTKTSTEYIVETASTTLEEAFEDLQLNMTKKLQSSDLDPTKTPRLKKGVILKESPSGKFTISISRDFELYSQDDLEISIEGSIEFDLDLNCTIEIKKGSLKKIRFTGTLTETASVGTTIEYKKELEEEITLGTLYFAPIVVGPVTFVPEVRLVMGVSMEGGIKLEAKVSQIASLTTGLEYNDGSWYPVGNFSTDFDVAPPELTASGEVKAYIGPDIALKIYGVVGPSIGIEGYFKGEAQLIPIEQRFFKIYGGIECSAGVEFTILSFFKLGYETTIIDWKKLIYEADLVYFGTPPKLLWAGEPYFKDTGVSPEVGVTTNTFVFRVKYKDDENNAPSQGYPKVHILKNGQEISGSPFTMDCVDINPYYKNGVIYEYYTRLSSGNYNYYFEAKDIMGNKAIAEAPVNSKSGPTVFKAPNKPPILTWTGEHYYGNYYYDNRGVCPYQGKPNRTPFVFRVMYQDPDGDQGYVKVHILKNGQEISGSPFLMDYFSGSYATGAIYRKIITLPSSGNDYTYYFEATDIYLEPASGEATQTKTGPNVDESFNHIPEVNWYGSWNYTNDGLDPEKGKPYATPFRYRITYRDIDNDPPLSGYPKLHIKKDGVEISSSPFTMGSYNTTYTSGVGYDSLIYLSSGVYSYYFEAYDVDGATATGVNKIEKQGPTVDSKPPQLLWVGDTNYETDGLHPESGKPKDNFVYRIKYKDPDDDPPKSGYPKLHIKKGGIEISSSPFSMTKESPYDTQFATGVVYKYTIKLSTGSDYSYYFEAEDDSGFNVITEEKKFYPTVTNQAPVLEWTGEENYLNDGLDPETGRPLENFRYRVKYKDPDGDPPESGYPKVHILKDSLEIQGSPFGWTFQSGEGDYKITGVMFEFNISLPSSGTYHYYFESKDENYAYASGEPTKISTGPIITNVAPILEWAGGTGYTSDGVEPDSGRPSTYTFRVKYKDTDNDPPASGFPKLHILKGGIAISSSPFTMTAESGGSYATGKIYKFEIKLSSGSNYSYYFEAKDIYNTSSTGTPTTSSTGPVVINNAPQLLWTAETNYESDGLHPETGKSTTTYIFRVKYKDPDNDPPASGFPKVHILRGSSEIINSPFSMNFVSSDTTGAIYTTSMTLLAGNYSYFFEAKDIYDAFAVGAPTGTKSGPFIVNTPPTLCWQGISPFENTGVYPSTGTTNDYFLFRVKYIDIDNDPPPTNFPKVYILKGGTNVIVSSMTPDGNNYISGVIYNYGTKLSTGIYQYYFEAMDINYNMAVGTPTLYQSGPTVYYAPFWVNQTIDTQGDVGRCSSIKLDANNYPHIAYVDATSTPNKVKYAKWTGSSWSTSTIADGDKTSIAYYNNNNIYISYFYSYSNTLKCAKWNGSSWSSEDAFYEQNGQSYCTSIAVGSDNVPQIAYAWCSFGANMGEYLKYAKKTGSSWNISTIDSGVQYNDRSISIALDSSNNPHVVYFVGNNLKYAKFDGVNWSTMTVDTQIGGNFGYYFASIAIKDNTPHIAYYNFYDSQNSKGDIKYAKWTGSSWSTSTIITLESNANYDVHPYIVIDNSNNPYIFYCLNTNYSLRYAKWTGSGWTLDNVPIDSNIKVSYPSVVIDNTGKIHISYYDNTNTNYDLKYVRFEK